MVREGSSSGTHSRGVGGQPVAHRLRSRRAVSLQVRDSQPAAASAALTASRLTTYAEVCDVEHWLGGAGAQPQQGEQERRHRGLRYMSPMGRRARARARAPRPRAGAQE